MIRIKKSKIMLIMILFLFILILPNYANAAKISVGKVKGVKVTSQDTSSIKITWSKVSKATGYRVYVYNSSKKKYEYYGKTTSRSMTIKKLKSAQEYKIKIRGYRTVKKKNYYGSYSSVLTTTTKPTQVKNLKARSQTDNSITLSWSKVSRATGYRVYIYNSSKKKYEYYGAAKTNSITIKKRSSAQTYQIKVRAYRTLNKTNYYGSYSSILTTVTKPKQTTGLKMSNNTVSTITLTWNKVSGASGYRVYMYNTTSKAYEYYGQITDNSVTISKDLATNKELKYATGYNFKVRAYITLNETKYYGSFSDILSAATVPSQVTGLLSTDQTTNSITIKWDKVDKATGYVVYIYSDSSQCFKQYNKTTETTMTITNLYTARFYKIYVKAYATINNKDYYGSGSNIISQRTKSTDSIKAGIDVSQHQKDIDWNQVKGKVDFAILRLGWIGNNNLDNGGNHTLDTKFVENYNECKRLGIPVGVYVYCYSSSVDAIKSGADWTVEQLKERTLDLPVFIDMEDKQIAGISKNNLSEMCTEYNSIVENAGFKPGIYANRNWFDNHLNSELKTKYTCWIAHYTDKDQNYEEQYSMWQYSSAGLISGISGNVDLNIIYFNR